MPKGGSKGSQSKRKRTSKKDDLKNLLGPCKLLSDTRDDVRKNGMGNVNVNFASGMLYGLRRAGAEPQKYFKSASGIDDINMSNVLFKFTDGKKQFDRAVDMATIIKLEAEQ